MKKVLSLILVICMLIPTLGITPLAAGNDPVLFLDASHFANNLGTWKMLDETAKGSTITYCLVGTAEDMPTVLDAVMYALEMNEVPFEVDNQDDPKGITSITLDGAEYATKTDDANIYGWTYTANGEEPKSGRMGVNLLNEGDVIVLTYFAQAKE